jgi:uncharacterized protein involved in tellurium resistance
MGLFGLGKKDSAPAPAASTPQAAPVAAAAPTKGLDLGKQSGKISLEKGSRVTIEKTQTIKARATWSSNTDYDLYALVVLKSGQVLTVSTFGSKAEPNPTTTVLNGAVRHLGDVGRGAKGVAEETIEINMTDDIDFVVPVAYSAQSNGTGSFRTYQVSLGINNGAGTEVVIDAKHANKSSTIYSVAIGVIRNTVDGVQIESLEEYSQPGSESRPAIVNGKVVMDAGAVNLYK